MRLSCHLALTLLLTTEKQLALKTKKKRLKHALAELLWTFFKAVVSVYARE
jgi:hypothetical protein